MRLVYNVILTILCILFVVLVFALGSDFFGEYEGLIATVGDMEILRILVCMLILFLLIGLALLWRQDKIMDKLDVLEEKLTKLVPDEEEDSDTPSDQA